MTYILRSRLTTHSSGRGVSLPFVVNEWFRLIDCSLECISAVVLRDVVAGSSLSEKSDRVGDLSLARRNARRWAHDVTLSFSSMWILCLLPH